MRAQKTVYFLLAKSRVTSLDLKLTAAQA